MKNVKPPPTIESVGALSYPNTNERHPMNETWILLEPRGPQQGIRFVGPFATRDEAETYNEHGIAGLLNPATTPAESDSPCL
jgi:hypothetical protein